MPIRSAGILLWRRARADDDASRNDLEVFLAHMGGPFWAKKDAVAWSIPKGEYAEDEDALAAARREFTEEIGTVPPALDYALLGEFRQASGKLVTAFVAESEFQIAEVCSNTFPVEWPPRSGRIREFPEVDRAEWMSLAAARIRVVRGQLPMLDALEQLVG